MPSLPKLGYSFAMNSDLSEGVLSLSRFSYWVSDSYVPKELAQELQADVLERRKKNEFRPAKIGKGLGKIRARDIRSDVISWVRDFGVTSALTRYRELIESFSLRLKRELFIPIKRFEAHFSIYPVGARYRRHFDQHKEGRHRQISTVLYLSHWQPGNGGELAIYPEFASQMKIEPLFGRFVSFISAEVPHEVLRTNQERISLTGWLRDDEIIPFQV